MSDQIRVDNMSIVKQLFKQQPFLGGLNCQLIHFLQSPSQKSPVPLNRYEDVNGQQAVIVTPNSTLSRGGGSAVGSGINAGNSKMIARALYNFQVRLNRDWSLFLH